MCLSIFSYPDMISVGGHEREGGPKTGSSYRGGPEFGSQKALRGNQGYQKVHNEHLSTCSTGYGAIVCEGSDFDDRGSDADFLLVLVFYL